MLIQEMVNEGYSLKSWSISTIRGERVIALILTKRNGTNTYKYKYVSSSPCSDTLLKSAHFTIPMLTESFRVLH